MSGELVPKLRVVRCPKCRLLLQEPPGCDLYKCGECGTTLQAKKRASVAVNSESRIQETDAATRNALDHVSEGGKCNDRKLLVPSQEDSLKEKATSPGECQNEDGECNGDQLVPFVLSDEEHETESDIYNLSHRRNRVSSKGCSTSNKIIHSEIEEINDGNLVEESKEDSVRAIPEVEITGSGSKEAEDLNGGNSLPERAEEELSSALKGEDAKNDKSAPFAPFGENHEVEITESNIEEELNDGKLSSEGAENVPDEGDSNNDQAALEGAKPEVHTTERTSTTERPSRVKGNILHVSPDKLEEGTPANPVSSHKQQKEAQQNIHHSFDRVRSVDTTVTTKLIDPSSELSGVPGKLSKSPTNRSSYAYDGSLSSYDGVDERFPVQHSHSFDNTSIIANGVSGGRTRKGKGLDTQHQSNLPNAKHHATKDSRGNQHKVVETTRNGHRHWMRTKRDEFPPKAPFHRSGSHSYYERGSSSNQMHDELYRSSSLFSHESSEDTGQEEMQLVSLIRNLQDRLNRTRYMSGEANGRQSKGVSYNVNHISSYHSRDFHDGRRFSHGLDYPSCNGRCGHGVNWRQRHNKFSRIPYSAEVTSNAHHVDHSCYHCCSQERHFSADMSPRVLFPHEELHRSCLGQDCCSFSPHSYPSSPQMFTPSKLPPIYGRETKIDDLRHRAPELRKYLREKMNLAAKRHHRPVAGGAPFVTCCKCFNLLQLPADFLLFKRTCHQLKCGECSEVLKFSVHGSHIISFLPDNAIGSDLNNQSEVISSSNLPSTSHANYYHYSPAEAISYYDDYGLSISKSYSSEGEPVSLAHSHHLHGNEYDNPSVSRGIFEPSTEKENIAPRYYSSRKGLVETDGSAIFSSNMSGSRKLASEIEARPPPKSSSLHILMGYSSPSQVIRGTRPYVEDN
uniref:Uncharacterized protein At5g05190 family n=1 Tax=Cajanus cajan TaxID=3821 RepID=A0A151SG48_CAJCA|nr:Uncharacterized protein At5g05190 family [Cajanus cajan]